MPTQKPSRKPRLLSIALLLSSPISYLLTGASGLTYFLLGFTVGVYVLAVYMIISLMRKVKQMKDAMKGLKMFADQMYKENKNKTSPMVV